MAAGTGGPGLVVSVLGAPRIELDGAAVTFDTRKATALLAYLAVTARTQRRESLAALLWPDADESRARSALRRTLSVIRKELGDLGPRITRDEVELVAVDGVTIDVQTFLSGAASSDMEEVASAAALWRDDLLAGFSLRDSPDFDDWQAREAERLRRVMSGTCARLVEATSHGDLAAAVAHAERWLDLDPLHEPAHRALMRLHAQRGDRAAAVQQYRQCIRIVDEELGVAPLGETTELYEAITAGEVGRLPAASDHPAAATVLGRYPFIGRDAEVDELLTAIQPGRVVVVEGEPGVGKTRLVEEVIARQGRPVPMARCYDDDGAVPYAPLVDLLRLAAADPVGADRLAKLPRASAVEVARLVPELGPDEDDEGPAGGPGAEARFLEGVVHAMDAAAGAPPGLLVVDDVQWADDATQQVLAHLLRRTTVDEPCLILTQRSGEVGDSGPLARALGDRQRDGSAATVRLGRLSAESVSAWVTDAVPAPEAADLADEVMRESEGLPFLVVALLDALVSGQAPADVGDLLRSRLSSLSDGGSQLLTTASVLGRSFTFDVVRAASGRSDEEAVMGLDELIARGLVDERATPVEPTYDFTHDQVRRYVYEHTSLARRRLLHHRAAGALLANRRPTEPAASVAASVAHHERLAGRDDLASEHFRQAGDHARAVYANADARSHYDAALALGHPEVAHLHEAIGDLETLDGRFVDAVASFERAAAHAAPGDVARIEGKLGGVHQRRGQWPSAEQHYREALRLLADDGSVAERARLTADLAITALRQGDTSRAGQLADEAVGLAEASGDDVARTHTGTVAGLLAAGSGDLDVARTLLAASFERAGRSGDAAARVAAANGLARVERMAGDLSAAEHLLVEALAECVAIGDRHREAALRDQLAHVLHDLDRRDDAMQELKQAVAIFADIGVEGGSIQTEIWRLSEWVDHSQVPRRNDPGTLGRENSGVSDDGVDRGDL